PYFQYRRGVFYMAERFVVKDTKSGEYLAEKFMRGFYFTNDISQAIRCKSKDEAQGKVEKQTVKSASTLTIDSVNFS
ncbi:MAG TPA: hypothetical protein PLQ04_08335, partial [Lachnospiraceae bacterium]|nr:hypothetical protein [Lachnospiraceae bacterium]